MKRDVMHQCHGVQQKQCIEVGLYGWLAQSDAETSSQVSFGGKTAHVSDRVKSLAMFWFESRVGKQFRASNLVIHCREVKCLNSFVSCPHGNLVTSSKI